MAIEQDGKYIGTVKVGEKGQIVIPKDLRDMFGIKPGDILLLLADTDRGIAIPPAEESARIKENIFKRGGQV